MNRLPLIGWRQAADWMDYIEHGEKSAVGFMMAVVGIRPVTQIERVLEVAQRIEKSGRHDLATELRLLARDIASVRRWWRVRLSEFSLATNEYAALAIRQMSSRTPDDLFTVLDREWGLSGWTSSHILATDYLPHSFDRAADRFGFQQSYACHHNGRYRTLRFCVSVYISYSRNTIYAGKVRQENVMVTHDDEYGRLEVPHDQIEPEVFLCVPEWMRSDAFDRPTLVGA